MSLYQAAAAMNASARWQEMVAGNLAASTIPGFKKQEISFEAVPASASMATASPLMPRAVLSTNFRPGEIRVTDVKTDLAIEGKAFFEVQLPGGARAYTRDGEFHVNSLGEMVTKQGHKLLGEGGPIQLDPAEPGVLMVATDGTVSQGELIRDKLRLVEFNDPKLLRAAGGGYFLADEPGLQPLNTAQSTVRQHCLETANTNSITEMAGLITSMRQFEANQRVLQMTDDRLSRAISELGSPTGS